MRCVVFGCKSDNQSKCFNKDIMFFRFPTEENMLRIWVEACGRSKFNLKYSRICSIHFEPSDYARNLQQELLNYRSKNHRMLKKDAKPSKFLPSNTSQVYSEKPPIEFVDVTHHLEKQQDMDRKINPIVLFEGYSKRENGSYSANCSCVLIKGPPNVIVDTMTAWDGSKIVEGLNKESLSPDDIDFVVCTHGHSDHIGCNYLFQKAKHIVGYSISHRDIYDINHDFSNGDEYVISEQIKVIPTPGHTMQDVTVLVNSSKGIIAITGDLFEKFEDLLDDNIWKEAGSDSEELQKANRLKVMEMADFIIPGHGPMFKVPYIIKNENE